MTVSSSTAKAGPYAGAGSTGPFTVPFRFLSASHLQVIRTSTSGIDTTLVLTTDYTVSGVGAASGSVTLTTALASGEKLTIVRSVPFTQLADYVNNDAFPAESHEDALDLLTMQTQQLKERVDASLTLPATVTGVDTELPTPESNKLIAWNEAANALQNLNPVALATIVAFGTSRADTFTGNGSQTQFTLTANPGALANLDVAIGGVTQVPGVDYTFSGTTLTFISGAPANGVTVLARYFQALPQGVTDSAASTFVQTGAGAVTRDAQAKMREFVSPQDFGAVGNGVADDTAAVQAALAASLYVDLGGPAWVYKISGVLTLRTGHFLRGMGAEVRQITSNTELFNCEGKSDITITGLTGRGVGTDYLDSDSARAVFLYGGTSGARITVAFCKLYAFSYSTVRAKAQNDVTFAHNIVEGPGAPTLTAGVSGRCYGFLADTGCKRVKAYGNSITKTAQGFRIEGTEGFGLTDNDIENIVGQHGIYLGSALTDGVISHNRIRNVDLIGIKLQAQNGVADNRRIVISGNTVEDCSDQGILTSNGAGSTSQTAKNRGITIVGNAVRTTSGANINVQNTIGATVVGNTCDAAGQGGINLSASSQITIANNVITASALSAITDENPSTQVVVQNNQIRDCATANTGGNRYGVYLLDMTEWTIRGNVISDSAAKMQYGMFLAGGDQTTVTVVGNQVLNATEYGVRWKNGTDAAREVQSNLWSGTLGPAFNDPALISVASAATLTLPTHHSVVRITGTTGITTITANGQAGRIVTLLFNGVLTVTRGSNVQIASNFTTSSQDTLTMCCDGTNWYEIARAVN